MNVSTQSLFLSLTHSLIHEAFIKDLPCTPVAALGTRGTKMNKMLSLSLQIFSRVREIIITNYGKCQDKEMELTRAFWDHRLEPLTIALNIRDFLLEEMPELSDEG